MAVAEADQWATITDVSELTRVKVDGTTRRQAVASIEALVGLIEEVPRPDVSDRDRYWLKLAVCYQAAWIDAQPDYFERNAVSSASQSGQSATGGNADWLLLAPAARKCIKRLSWRGVRPLAIDDRRAETRSRVDVTSEEYDDSLPWGPL